MRRYGIRGKAWVGGGVLTLVAGTMIAAVPAVPPVDGGAVAPERVEGSGLVGRSAPAEVVAAEAEAAAEVEAGAAAEMEAGAEVVESAVLETQVGSASYYADMLAGRRTASGVRYDPSAAVAAHRELPFGTRLRVHNLSNGRTVEVEVVDRGPFAKGRILDLSRSAARDLGFIREGHTRVRVEVLEYGG